MSTPLPYKVVRLDRRFTGWGSFEYCLDYRYGLHKTDAFLNHRAWFWETYGASGEYVFWTKVSVYEPKISNRWAWDSNYNQRRIYVRDAETLSPFLLTFG